VPLGDIPLSENSPTDVITPPLDEAPLPSTSLEDIAPKKKTIRLGRLGGAYVPPQRAALMAQDLPGPGTEDYQRLLWDALRKSLNGLINKVNTGNLKEIIVELLGENLVRGRGLLVRAVSRAQAVALPFTPVYAGMIAVLNTKLPQIGELMLVRLVHHFRRAYRRNDKTQCLASSTFLAHLVNQRVAHEIVALQLLTLLLERPTDDSVEIAVGLMRECGAGLQAASPRPTAAVFERFRVILHESQVSRRIQYMVEVLFQLRQDGFKGHEAISGQLDLVAEEDQITHYVGLDDELDVQEDLNVFKYDQAFAENEARYEAIKEEILGDSDDDQEEVEQVEDQAEASIIKDETGTDLINLRKTIYLTVMSSVDFEECGHKLLKLNIPLGLEGELCTMIVECCAQERTYLRFFGLLAERFAHLDPVWRAGFERAFADMYATVHRLDTGRIRNISKLYGHLLYTSALPWTILAGIHLSEEATTSASRILIKFLFQDLLELYGLAALKRVLLEEADAMAMSGLFPREDLRDCRFAINFWTAIGMGALTEGLRLFLAEQSEKEQAVIEHRAEKEREEIISIGEHVGPMHGERAALLNRRAPTSRPASGPNGPNGSSEALSDTDSYESQSPPPPRVRSRDASPHARHRDRSPARRHDRERSPPPRRRDSRERSPPRRRARSRTRSRSVSRTPPRRHRD